MNASVSATKGRLILAGIIGAGILLALGVVATNQESIGGSPLTWAIGGAFLFNMVSVALAWSLTRSARRRYLLGRYPFVLGAAKLIGFAAMLLLLVLLVIGLLVGGQFGEFALRALVRGLVAFAILSMITNGLLNALVVVRHFRGTLAATSENLDQRT